MQQYQQQQQMLQGYAQQRQDAGMQQFYNQQNQQAQGNVYGQVLPQGGAPTYYDKAMAQAAFANAAYQQAMAEGRGNDAIAWHNQALTWEQNANKAGQGNTGNFNTIGAMGLPAIGGGAGDFNGMIQRYGSTGVPQSVLQWANGAQVPNYTAQWQPVYVGGGSSAAPEIDPRTGQPVGSFVPGLTGAINDVPMYAPVGSSQSSGMWEAPPQYIYPQNQPAPGEPLQTINGTMTAIPGSSQAIIPGMQAQAPWTDYTYSNPTDGSYAQYQQPTLTPQQQYDLNRAAFPDQFAAQAAGIPSYFGATPGQVTNQYAPNTGMTPIAPMAPMRYNPYGY